MTFLNKTFLIALAAIALPLLIHLLTRDRIRKVAFSTMRFFARNTKAVLRRKKFQEAILLATRAAICALIALAFARPLFKSAAQGETIMTAGTAKVIIVDVSASMALADLEAVKAKARGALDGMSRDSDAAALITFSSQATVLAGMTRDLDGISSAIDKIEPTQGPTGLSAALQQADQLLAKVKARDKQVVLVSDLHKSGARRASPAGGAQAATGPDAFRLSPGVKLIVEPVETTPPAGAVIAGASAPNSVVLGAGPAGISLKLANMSAADAASVPVSLTVNDALVATQEVTVKAGSTAAVRFTHSFTKAGDNPGIVRVGSKPAGTFDAFHFNVRVIPRIGVLVLNGSPSANSVLDAAFFPAKAITPAAESPFAATVVKAPEATAADVAAAKVVVLADVADLPRDVADSLLALLHRGGGIVFMPGDQVVASGPEAFNKTFGALSPCRLLGLLDGAEKNDGASGAGAASSDDGVGLSRLDLDHPSLAQFRNPRHGNFSLVRFYRRWEVGDAMLSRVLAYFDDNRPAILERPVAQGYSVLLAGSCDLAWTNFQMRSTFLPFLHETIKRLAIPTERRTTVSVGTVLKGDKDQRLKGPDGVVHSEETPAALAGFYQVIDAADAAAFTYAVNVEPSEWETAHVAADELKTSVQADESAIALPTDIESADAAQRRQLEDGDRTGIWWYLAAAVAGLFVLELFLANRTVRH